MYKELSNSYTTKVLIILHPQPDLTKRQLIYLTATKKYEHTVSIFLNVDTYLSTDIFY